jgi:surface carbohydrate biosynthesis protein
LPLEELRRNSISLLTFIKRFRVIDKSRKDIIIVDEEGSDSIKYCIPSLNSYVVIPIRNKIPIVLNIKFFARYILRVICRDGIRLSVLYSIIDILDPKVIISFIDNAPKMGIIQTSFPNKLVISVQNGLRTKRYKFPAIVPNLYGFGYYEKDLLSDLNSLVKGYKAVGSLRYGIFIEKQNTAAINKYDVCYISQFSHHNDAFIPHLEKKCFDRLVDVCQKKKYSLSVALRHSKGSPGCLLELEHFHKLDTNNYATYVDNNAKVFSSYALGLSSSVIASFLSTLAYELFGAGKKVLFLGTGSKEMINYLGSEDIFSRMPNEVCLNNLSSECIEKKISELMIMPEGEYLSSIVCAQKYYMNFNDEYPHKIIKKRISNFIKS